MVQILFDLILSYIYILIFTNSCIRLYLAYVLYPQGGTGLPCPPLFALVHPSCALSVHVQLLSGSLLWIHVPALAVFPGMSKGLGRGEGFKLDLGSYGSLT